MLLLTLEDENTEFYIASLALGILQGIKLKALNPEVGIWTLGRPIFKEPLLNMPISKSLKQVIDSFDELEAIFMINPQNFNDFLSNLIFECAECQKNALASQPNLAIKTGNCN